MQKESLGQETEVSRSVAATVTGADQDLPLKIVACVVLAATQKVGPAQDTPTASSPTLAVGDHDVPS